VCCIVERPSILRASSPLAPPLPSPLAAFSARACACGIIYVRASRAQCRNRADRREYVPVACRGERSRGAFPLSPITPGSDTWLCRVGSSDIRDIQHSATEERQLRRTRFIVIDFVAGCSLRSVSSKTLDRIDPEIAIEFSIFDFRLVISWESVRIWILFSYKFEASG